MGSEWLGQAPLLLRLYLRTPISVVRDIFKSVLVPMARIQFVLGIGFNELEALLNDGPREEERFISSLENIEAARDLNLDISVRQIQIL